MNKCVFLIFFLFLIGAASAQNSKGDTTAKAQGLVEKYDLIISKAATAVSNENFDEAKVLYNEALALKPNDPFASGMLVTVNNSLKALEVVRLRNLDLKRKAEINNLFKQAESEVSAKNYESAKKHYNEALALNPIKSQEDFAKQRIRALDFALSSGKSTATINSSQANNSVTKLDTPAVSLKRETKNINTTLPSKPANEPAKKLEKEIKAEKDSIRTATSVANENVTKKEALPAEHKPADTNNTTKASIAPTRVNNNQKNDFVAARKAKVDSLIENAIKAINRENWQAALDLYSEVLTLQPTAAQEKAINSEIIEIRRKIDKAKSKPGELTMAKPASPALKSSIPSNDKAVSKPAAPTIAAKTKDTAVSGIGNKNTAISPANNVGLITSMPTVAADTAVVPKNETTTVAIQDNDKDDIEFSKRISNQPSLSHLTDVSNQVRLICLGISTNGKNTFLKFIIQNQRPDFEFNIGSLQMSYIQNSGKLKKLNVRYISDSKVVLPKKELPIVVVIENQPKIEPNEVFVFEMEDQPQNTRLTINISADNLAGKNSSGNAF